MAASSAAAGAVGVSMVAVTCGATAIAALLLSQHETKEARLAEALQLLAQKEEQLQQAFRERSRLSDQLAAEREARLHVERSASRANVSTAPAGGQVSDAPKPLALDPRLLGLMPAHPPSSKSSHALETRESSSEGSNIVRDSTSGASGSEAVSTPPQTDSQHSASAELVKLRQADVEGVVQFLHRHNLSEHETVFRQQNVRGNDLCDVLEPDKHGFSAEQKLGWLGIKGDAQVVAFAAVLEQLMDAAEGD